MLKRALFYILSCLLFSAPLWGQNTPGQLGVGNGTGTPPAVPPTGFFYFEALNPIATSWAWVPDAPLPSGKGGIVNCDFDANGNCIQHWFPYPNASCTMGQNWNGKQWVCVTAAEIAAGLKEAGYTVTQAGGGQFTHTPNPSDSVTGFVTTPTRYLDNDEDARGPQVRSPAFEITPEQVSKMPNDGTLWQCVGSSNGTWCHAEPK
jgi:hypothetical protein